MKKMKIYCLPIIATLIFFLFPGQQADAAIQIIKQGKSIMISGELENPSSVEIRIYSSRNHTISSYLQVSPENPDAKQIENDNQQLNWDIFYPVVDVIPSESMQGVAEFDQSLNTLYSANGMFNEALFIMKGNKNARRRQLLEKF